MECIKHVIECHCILPQYKTNPTPVWHKFVVFSIIDDADCVVPKHARCNNCGVVHNVIDIGKSEVLSGQEVGAVMDKDDIAMMLPESLKNILISYNCDVATWEHVLFVLQNSKFPSNIVVSRTEESGITTGKLLTMQSHGSYQIKPYSTRTEI
jgi:hypothetical protein